MLRKRGQKGFTLIELLIVIAIIGILAAIAIPMYRAQTVKAKLTEVTNSMSNVATAVAAYYQDEGRWPGVQTDEAVLKTSLGVGVPVGAKYIEAASVSDGDGVITFAIQGTGEPTVDASDIVMTPTTTASGCNNLDLQWVLFHRLICQRGSSTELPNNGMGNPC